MEPESVRAVNRVPDVESQRSDASTASSPRLPAERILALQRSSGNVAVQRMLSAMRGGSGGSRLARNGAVVSPVGPPATPFMPGGPVDTPLGPVDVPGSPVDGVSEGADDVTLETAQDGAVETAEEGALEAVEEGGVEAALEEGAVVAGSTVAAVFAGLVVLLWPNSTAPAWMDETNPITGGPYASEAEYNRIKQMSPEDIAAARAASQDVGSSDNEGMQAAPKPPELSQEETTAVENKRAGRPYDVSAYNSAMQKIKEGEKYLKQRNKQKRKGQ